MESTAVIKKSRDNGFPKLFGLTLCIAIPCIIWVAPLPVEPTAKHALAVASFMVVAWITEPIDHAISGLIGCFLFWVLGIVRFDVAFSGFANSTTWYLFGATIMGVVATKSGLARRIAIHIMLRIGTTYPRILLGLIITGFLLTLVVPSGIARVVILAAIALGLVETFELKPGSNVARGIFLIITYTSALFDKMIIAGASSITARGFIETVGGVEVQWSRWLIAFLPCDIITILTAWILILTLFAPEQIERESGEGSLRQELRNLGQFSSTELRAAILFLSAMLLWVTDFIHHISSSKIGLGVGLVALLPYVGVLRADDLKKMNWLPVVFVASAIGMGKVLVATKSLSFIASIAFEWMQSSLTNVLATTTILYWMAFAYHIFLSSDVAMLGTSMPLLMTFAKTHGLDPLTLGMIWTFGSAGKIFVYQSAVLIVGYSFGYFRAIDLLRVGLLMTVVEFVVILALVLMYWPMIGIQ